MSEPVKLDERDQEAKEAPVREGLFAQFGNYVLGCIGLLVAGVIFMFFFPPLGMFLLVLLPVGAFFGFGQLSWGARFLVLTCFLGVGAMAFLGVRSVTNQVGQEVSSADDRTYRISHFADGSVAGRSVSEGKAILSQSYYMDGGLALENYIEDGKPTETVCNDPSGLKFRWNSAREHSKKETQRHLACLLGIGQYFEKYPQSEGQWRHKKREGDLSFQERGKGLNWTPGR